MGEPGDDVALEYEHERDQRQRDNDRRGGDIAVRYEVDVGEIRDRRATLPLLTILANGRYHDL